MRFFRLLPLLLAVAAGPALAQNIGPSGAPFTITNLTNGACAINSTTQAACANWFRCVNPVWTGATCNGSGDDVPGFEAAETLAYTINSSAGLPILYPSNLVCQFQQPYVIAHDGLSWAGQPKDIVYDAGSHKSDAGYLHLNTGFTTHFYAGGNCAIDLNGHHNFTANWINAVGDGAQQGTVMRCNSYTSQPGDQLPTMSWKHGSISLMGNTAGGPINTTAYTSSATGTCTGTLCGNLIEVRDSDSIMAENGWAYNGALADLFLNDVTLPGDGCGGITGFSTTTPDMNIVHSRIEAIGYGIGSTCPVGGPGLGNNGTGWNLTGVQFEVNAGPDVALLTGWKNFSMNGGHMLGGGTNNGTGSRSSIYVNAGSGSPVNASFNGVAFIKNGTFPAYAVEFAAGDTFSDYISIKGGSMGSGIGYNTAQTLGTAPAHYFVDTLNEPITGAIVAGLSVPAISTSTFAINAGPSNTFRIVLVHAACPCTISNPTNPVDGKKITLEVVQSATGSDTIGTWGTNFDFGTAGTPTLTTTAGKEDFLGFQYSSQNSKWNFLGIQQGM